ncbi:MAG: succinylglutamate desuccinylase/aspartoacylase family protein [Kiritimatiellia bacterium]
MTVTIGNLVGIRGTTVYGSLPFEQYKLPVAIVVGRKERPVLLLVGMQHATEFSGPGAVDRVLAEIEPNTLEGTLVCLPVVNPLHAQLTAEAHRELWKKPETNLNRQWPGDASSDNPLSRLAALVWREAVTKADALLDMHCCRPIDPRFAACLESHRASEELAAALGLEAVDRQTPTSYHERQLHIVAAQQLGVPTVLVESHPSLFQTREAVYACAGAVMCAMVHLGIMSPLPPCEKKRQHPLVFRRATPAQALKANSYGYLGIRRWAGDRVKKGETVAVVRSLETFEVIEQLESPLDGAVGCAGHPEGEALIAAGTVAAMVKPEEPYMEA